jgi:CHAT domain-containing protein
LHFVGHGGFSARQQQAALYLENDDRTALRVIDADFAGMLARLQTPPQLVVLAACSTAAGAISRGEGAMSLARPFLGAGIPLVIASQWDVDDRATAELFGVFHRQLAVMRDPVQALRTAQLALLRGATEGRTPAAWGAFVAMGTTTH